MERYGAYKDSGGLQYGMIPSHWEIRRVKQCFVSRDSERIPVESSQRNVAEGTYPYYGANGIQDFVDEYIFDEALVLVGEDGSVLRDDGSPFVTLATGRYWVNNHAHILEPVAGKIEVRFAAYSLASANISTFVTGTTMLKLTQGNLMQVPCVCPPLHEQQAIADYLDAKTAEIDALVADCEREVELLREYRKAVISEAVTKGLDPGAPMKDSGVEWIGEIPEGWQIVRVKFLAKRLNVGVVINPSTYYDDNGAIPFLKGSNIQGESIDLSDVSMITEESNELLQKTQIHTGDIVMVRVGDPGRSVVVPPELDGANVASMLEVTCGDAVIPEYLCRVFNSHLSALQVGLYTYGAAMKQINVSDLAEFYIPIPESIEEQERMASELNRKTRQIDAFIDAKQTMVKKLREYRRSLISEAVTGKFKVPGVR